MCKDASTRVFVISVSLPPCTGSSWITVDMSCTNILRALLHGVIRVSTLSYSFHRSLPSFQVNANMVWVRMAHMDI